MTNSVTGKLYWFKALDSQVHEDMNGDLVWSFDLSLDQGNATKLKTLGLGSKIKNKGDDRGEFTSFIRRKAKKLNGKENSPIDIVNPDGTEWDQTKEIGNGTLAKVEFNTYTSTFKKKVFNMHHPMKVTILEYMKYESKKKESKPVMAVVPNQEEW